MPQRHTLLALALTGAMLSAPLAAQQKPTLKPTDYQKWESLGATRISPDGKWVAVGINRVSDENELRLRGGARDTTITTALAVSAAFTNDSRWIGYLVQLPPKEREKLTKERKPIRTSFGARDLASGATIELADVSAFSFSADGRFVALTRYPAEGKRVQEVVVHDLRSGTRWSFGNVGEHSWSEVRALLAFTVNVEGGVGSSFQLFDGDAGATRVLDASSSIYRAIGWRPKAADVAVLRSIGDKAFADTANAVLAWRSANEPASTVVTFDPSSNAAGLAKELRIAEGRRPSWSRDGATLFIGLQSRLDTAAMPKKSTEKVSDVEIWHPNDVRVIPQQRSSESQDLRATRVAAWKLGAATVTPLGSDAMEQQVLLPGDRYLIEIDSKPYAWGTMFGRRDQDVWIVDVTDGSRKKLLEKIRFVLAPDPTGRRVAWFDGKDYWAAEIASGKRTNLTAPLTGARRVDFVDRDDDHPSDVLSPIGGPAWSRDGERFLVYDQVDLWSLALDGSGGTRLTDGAGEQLEHRIHSFAGFNASAVDRSVDLTKPVYLSLYGRRTKKSGYARLANGRVERLLLADAAVGALAKADSTDRYTFTRQTFVESPNVFAAGADLANPSRLTNTNPFQSDYAWGKAELMDFTSTVGKRLQAILYYPANYDPSKKYPMIVYTYELLSQGLHGYITPREYSYYNANNFTQLGYFVLMPDIVFRPREPGVSVLHAVEPAVRAVLARGLVDPANVGHMGHSQGGYEAAFLATHSTLFKTAVMGAGISDMFSFAGQMHWSSVPEFDHWETGQFRMQVPPWEDWESMRRNNPIERVHNMPAKSILIEIGGDDPTVDMRQGVEFYNYARRAGKQAVMLLYPGEGHGLGKRENAIDYHRRIVEWFGYYLKGEPPAKWITDGQTWIERKRILDVNK